MSCSDDLTRHATRPIYVRSMYCGLSVANSQQQRRAVRSQAWHHLTPYLTSPHHILRSTA